MVRRRAGFRWEGGVVFEAGMLDDKGDVAVYEGEKANGEGGAGGEEELEVAFKGEEERLVGCVADGAQALGWWEVFNMPALGSWDFGARCDSRDGVGDGRSEVSEFAVMVAWLRVHVAEEVFDFGVVDSKEGFGDEVVVWWEEAEDLAVAAVRAGFVGVAVCPGGEALERVLAVTYGL